MKKITISNFRKIKDTWTFDLAPITFLTGTNNSGKSTLIKSFLVLEDYFSSNNHFVLKFNGSNYGKHKIENMTKAFNKFNLKDGIKDLRFSCELNDMTVDLDFTRRDPNDSDGFLKSMKLTKDESSNLFIEHIWSKEYQMEIDQQMLEEEESMSKSESSSAYYSMLAADIKGEINVRENKIAKVNSDLKQVKKDIKRVESGDKDLILDYAGKLPNSKVSFEDSALAMSSIIETERQLRKFILQLKEEVKTLHTKYKDITKLIEVNEKESKYGAERIKYSPQFSIDNYQGSQLTIADIIKDNLPKYLVDKTGNSRKGNDFKNADESLEMVKAIKLGDSILKTLSFKLIHLSPHRSNQSKLFVYDNKDVDIAELLESFQGRHISQIQELKDFIKKWLKIFDIGEDFRIRSYESSAATVEVFGDGDWINLSDKGFGAGQIFTIILSIYKSYADTVGQMFYFDFENDLNSESEADITTATYKKIKTKIIILIEEPEANLHPSLQSKLAELFLEAYRKFNIQFIVETHSEYLIRQTQVLVKESTKLNNIFTNPFAVYYFGADKGPYQMEYDEEGKFIQDFGPGFFDQSRKLTRKLL